MDLAWTGQVQGDDTFRWVCPSCGKITNLQTRKGPNGKVQVRQVSLNGDSHEFVPHDSFRLQVNSATGWEREFDLTGEIEPAFAIAKVRGIGMPGSFFAKQVGQVSARAAQAQAAYDQRCAAQAAYVQRCAAQQVYGPGVAGRGSAQAQAMHAHAMQVAQAQARQFAQARARGAIRQPVGYTLGAHPQATRFDPNAYRRRILGLPQRRRR